VGSAERRGLFRRMRRPSVRLSQAVDPLPQTLDGRRLARRSVFRGPVRRAPRCDQPECLRCSRARILPQPGQQRQDRRVDAAQPKDSPLAWLASSVHRQSSSGKTQPSRAGAREASVEPGSAVAKPVRRQGATSVSWVGSAAGAEDTNGIRGREGAYGHNLRLRCIVEDR
jgi:hypothetical protein